MGYSKGHRRRPTSIAADEIFRTTNMYVASDGQILQSSLVKEGSPSKRRLTGSMSQVRFDLPESSSSEEEPEDDEVDSFLSEDWEDIDEDRTGNRVIYNTESHLTSSIKGGLSDISDRYAVSQSMRALVETSPERNKLFIRPHTELNPRPIAIPVEARLPPQLSPMNKARKRPTSLIFNGLDYEPLELNFIDAMYLSKKLNAASLDSPIPLSLQPPTTREIMIPELGEQFVMKQRPRSMLVDNEREISNPSPAAKKLNNNLNRTFSFPPRRNTASQPSVSSFTDLPHPPANSHAPVVQQQQSTTDGLKIFATDGLVRSQSPLQMNPLGRFASPSIPQRHGAIYSHIRSESNVRIVPELEDEGETIPEKIPQPLRRQPLINSRRVLPPVPAHSLEEQSHVLQRPTLMPRSESVQSVISQDSIQQSVQSIQDTVHSLQESASSIRSNDSTQLFDLRDMIISSGGNMKLTTEQIENMDKSIASQSQIYDEPLDTSSMMQDVEQDYQPLGGHWKPQIIYEKDIREADAIRSVSQSMMKLTIDRSLNLLSQSSYQSEVSQPFSQPSSAITADTVLSEEPVMLHERVVPQKGVPLGRPLNPSTTSQNPYREVMKEMPDGQFREIIELDCDDTDECVQTKRTTDSPAFSTFSFETVSSEVQMGEHAPMEAGTLRRYTSKRKSVMELLDESMANSKQVMDHLKRQRTVLIQRRNELMKVQIKDYAKLQAIERLQANVKRVHSREEALHREISTKERIDHYFDYANEGSCDFDTFMRTKSSVSLASSTSGSKHIGRNNYN